MTKKTNAKPETKPEKKPAKGDAKKPGKRADTSPAEKPAGKKGKAKRAPDAAHEEAVEREAPPPTPPPAPAAPVAEAPPAPPPPLAPASTASVLVDDPSRWIDGRSLHEKGKYLLNVCPKAKENPAEACIALRGQVAAATDERSCFWVDFGCVVCESPLKVTRASFDAFMALLDGELKAAEKLEASVIVRWDGLVATIRREGEEDGRPVTLDRFESGPGAEHFFLETPEFADGSHAVMSIERLRTAATWKGDGTAHLFVSPSARQVWILFDAGGDTFARATVAFEGANLGVRQPSLPMDTTGRKPAAQPPAAQPPAAPAAPVVKPEPQEVEAEVIQPGGPRGLPSGIAWVRVECDRGAAWERLSRQATEMLAPFAVDGADASGEGGVVVWGPYPRSAARVRFVFLYLRSQGADPRVVPCEGVNLWNRALAEATGAPPPGLIAGLAVAALPSGGEGGEGGDAADTADTAGAFPTLRDDGRAELRVDHAAWLSLPADVAAEVNSFPWVEVTEVKVTEEERVVVLAPMNPVEVAAVTELLAAAGLRFAGVEPGEDCETWFVAGPSSSPADLAAFPEPGERPVVVEIPEAIWDELTPDQLNDLHTPTKVTTSWLTGPTSTSSLMLAAPEARAVGALLAGWGFRCERQEDTTRYGAEVTTWHVGRAGEKAAAL